MSPKEAISNVATGLAVLCAVIVTIVTLRHELSPASSRDTVGPRAIKPTPQPDWAKYSSAGHRIGPADAAVTIVEFADFECPFCAQFATEALQDMRNKYPTQLAVIYRHYPIAGHRFAYPAARAAECAAAQGRFEAFHDLLFRKQDSLGLKSFSQFARDAGVTDLAAFDQCDAKTGTDPAVEVDKAAATALGAIGTPTLLINRERFDAVLPTQMLDSLVRLALAGKK